MKKILLAVMIILNLILVGCGGADSVEDVYKYDENGYDENGYDKYGYNQDGFDENGYDEYGYDSSGYDVNGYDENGLDINGYDENGEPHFMGSLDDLKTTVTDANGVTGVQIGNADPIMDMAANSQIETTSGNSEAKNAYLESIQYAEDALNDAYVIEGNLKLNLWDAYDIWDYELNRIYGLLEEKLSSQEMDELRNEQRAWIKKRDENTDPEVIGYLTQVEVLNSRVRERTLYLIDLYFE